MELVPDVNGPEAASGQELICRQRLTGSVQRKNSALLNQVPGGNIRAIICPGRA
jgi:hypothetical protein